MKNKLAISLIAASVIAGSLFADKLESVEGLTTSRIICESGVEGFVLSIVRENAEDAVLYESCSSDGIDVETKELVETRLEQLDYVIPRLPGDFVTLGGTEYYFPNGYTEPTVAANNTCSGGYNDYYSGAVTCSNPSTLNGSTLSEGWLNLNHAGRLYFGSNYALTDITNLKNLTRVEDWLMFHATSITNLDALSNLRYVKYGIGLHHGTPITDISGLNNLEYAEAVYFDPGRVYEVKLSADSWICQNFDSINGNNVSYSNACQ